MSILQVTPDGVKTHEFPQSEERHPRLNTIEAMRYIAGLTRSQREHFEELTNPELQERMMRRDLTFSGRHGELAGHLTSRALQAVRHFYESDLFKPTNDQITVKQPPYYVPLMDTPKCPDVANTHWDQESRFRRGITTVLASLVEIEPFDMPLLERGKTVSEDAALFEFEKNHVAMVNAVNFTDEMIIGSSYTFSRTA